MSLRFAGFTFSMLLVSAASLCAGAFDDIVGTYKGRVVEYSNAVYYYQQTVVVDSSSQALTMRIQGPFGPITAKEKLTFKDNGKVAGSGAVAGYRYTWTVRGTWRKVGDVIKGNTTTWYSDGDFSFSSFSQRIRNGKLVISTSGSSGGTSISTSFKGSPQ